MKNRVEELRKAKGLNQDEFARALKVSRQTISSIENGKYNPSLDLAFDIALFFEKTIEEIFSQYYAMTDRLKIRNASRVSNDKIKVLTEMFTDKIMAATD